MAVDCCSFIKLAVMPANFRISLIFDWRSHDQNRSYGFARQPDGLGDDEKMIRLLVHKCASRAGYDKSGKAHCRF